MPFPDFFRLRGFNDVKPFRCARFREVTRYSVKLFVSRGKPTKDDKGHG